MHANIEQRMEWLVAGVSPGLRGSITLGKEAFVQNDEKRKFLNRLRKRPWIRCESPRSASRELVKRVGRIGNIERDVPQSKGGG